MSSSPMPLKNRSVGQRCTLNLSRAEMLFHWSGMVVMGGQVSSTCHLTMVQNCVVRCKSPRVAEQCDVNIQSLTHTVSVLFFYTKNYLLFHTCVISGTILVRAVGSLVVRESDSRPDSLGSMPPNSFRVINVLVKSVGPKVLWAETRVQGTGEYFPPLKFHGKIAEVKIVGFAIYRSFGGFLPANLYCPLYGAQGLGQRPAYL
ncbi:uncharacterized protein TNCV_1068621 [Trichonephila clavipes]|nr:uncharacterized protein TNCV_1068621 [Trichonephila clavipes]